MTKSWLESTLILCSAPPSRRQPITSEPSPVYSTCGIFVFRWIVPLTSSDRAEIVKPGGFIYSRFHYCGPAHCVLHSCGYTVLRHTHTHTVNGNTMSIWAQSHITCSRRTYRVCRCSTHTHTLTRQTCTEVCELRQIILQRQMINSFFFLSFFLQE